MLPYHYVCTVLGETDAEGYHWFQVEAKDPEEGNDRIYTGYIRGDCFCQLTPEEVEEIQIVGEIPSRTYPALGTGSLMLPKGLLTIGEDAFSGIPARRIVVPDGCTSIGRNAFSFRANLDVLELPDTVTDIDREALHSSEGVVVFAPAGSYAVGWAESIGIQVVGF